MYAIAEPVAQGVSVSAMAVLVRPPPTGDIGLVDAVLVRVIPARDLLILELFFGVGSDLLQFRHSLDDVHRETKAVGLILDCKLERCVDIALLFVSAHVHIAVICSAICQTVDEPWISVEVEDDGLIDGKERIKIRI